MKATNRTSVATQRYVVEFSVAIGLYLFLLFWTRTAFRNYHGTLETVIALAPMFAVCCGFTALSIHDEFNQRLMTDSLGIAGVITALVAMHGFLEGDALPHPSAWWTWSVFMFSWLAASLVLKLRYR